MLTAILLQRQQVPIFCGSIDEILKVLSHKNFLMRCETQLKNS